MKTEHLLNSDHNVDAERPVEQGRTEPRLRISTQGKIDLEHDAVYFGAGSSSKSFSGYVSRCLEDQEVSEYIRRSNPALYERLWGIPQYQQHNLATQATTEHAGLGDGAGDGRPPMDATIQLNNEMAGATSSSDQSCARRPTSIVSPKSPDSITSIDSCGGHLLSIPSSKKPALQSAVSPLRSKSELQQDLYLLQQKRYIQSLLLNDHILVLQKVPPAEAKVRSRSCDHFLCRYGHGIPPRAYRLSLESRRTLEKSTATTEKYYSPKDGNGSKYLKVRSTKSRGFYCLTCIEDLFNGVGMLDNDYASPQSSQQASSIRDSPSPAPVFVDGSSDNIAFRTVILKAAETLLTDTRLVTEDRIRTEATFAAEPAPAENICAFGHHLTTNLTERIAPVLLAATSAGKDVEAQADVHFSSNSDQAIFRREARRQETEATLKFPHQIAGRQQARHLSQSSSDRQFPSLKILRPINISPWNERYKKQGLTEQSRRLYRRSTPANLAEDDDSASVAVNVQEKCGDQLVPPVARFCYRREPDNLEGIVQCSAEFCLIGAFHLKYSGLPRLPTKNETWFCNQCSALFGSGTFNPVTLEHDVVLQSTLRAASEPVTGADPGNVSLDEPSTDETSLLLSDDESMDPTYALPVTPRRQNRSTAGTAFTPYTFLDGASDGRPKDRSPHIADEITAPTISVSTAHSSIKDQPKCAKPRPTRTRRASTLALQAYDEPSTPKSRPKRTSSPPAPLTPPSRHSKTSFGHLASFIYAETRTSAAALSNPQVMALEKWKSIHLYSPLMEIIQSSRDAAAAPTIPNPSAQNHQKMASDPSTLNVATIETSGTVIDLPAVHGKKLSQVLAEVDILVESELRKQGSAGWEQGVHAREEAVRIGKAKGSQVDEQNGVTSPKTANEVRRRISRGFNGGKERK